MNKSMLDVVEQLVARARRGSNVVAINPIVEKVRLKFPETPVDEIAVVVLRCLLAADCKVVWEGKEADQEVGGVTAAARTSH